MERKDVRGAVEHGLVVCYGRSCVPRSHERLFSPSVQICVHSQNLQTTDQGAG